jgi:15-cis-phytoene synthase
LKEQGYQSVNLDSAQITVCQERIPVTEIALSPPMRLAVAYARADLRAGFELLLRFDVRLADIVGRASEPMIAQMKLAWWHDAVGREPALRPKGEPVFQALNDIALPEVERAMGHLLDAWGQLLAADEWRPDVQAAFAAGRSLGIFGAYANLANCDQDVSTAGQAWALADLRQRFGARVIGGGAPKAPTCKTRELRPLSILAYSVIGPSGIGMMWHALTGR